jgi:hypothetical protein
VAAESRFSERSLNLPKHPCHRTSALVFPRGGPPDPLPRRVGGTPKRETTCSSDAGSALPETCVTRPSECATSFTIRRHSGRAWPSVLHRGPPTDPSPPWWTARPRRERPLGKSFRELPTSPGSVFHRRRRSARVQEPGRYTPPREGRRETELPGTSHPRPPSACVRP